MLFIGYPPPDLAHYIDSCWSITSEGKSGTSFHEIFPDSNMKLVFRFSLSACRMVLMGPVTEKSTVEIDEASDYFGFRFRPGQTPRLADVHAADLVDSCVDILQIRGVSIDSLAGQLCPLQDHAQRQRVMEELVRGCLPLVTDRRCLRATALVDAHGGRLRVNELASRLGLHIRTLERLFNSQLGVSPKRLTRFLRLRQIFSHLHAGKYESLAELAHACGYADQSHMIKEFKELTGRLPGDKAACEPQPVAGPPRTRIVHRYRP